MPRDKEKQKEYNRLRYIANKDKLKEIQKAYRQTPQGKKTDTMRSWRRIGVNEVNDAMYDRYINTHCCDVCNKEFKNSRDRHLDHNHETGDFRQILCQSCNTYDNWKKKISAEN